MSNSRCTNQLNAKFKKNYGITLELDEKDVLCYDGTDNCKYTVDDFQKMLTAEIVHFHNINYNFTTYRSSDI